MGTVQATLKRRAVTRAATKRKRPAPKVSEDQLRHLLDRALAEVDADDGAGPLLRATGLRARLRIPDVGLVLDVEAAEEDDGELRWTFSESLRRKPKLELIMDSQTANAYLQGRESLAIGMARNRVRCKGEARWALVYLPALRVVVDAYRRAVLEDAPQLVI